ncbi:hypothetical protein Dsin_008971 [Dipteronia sinensis]|nr:hypothetical protein Dsin_008971 [Dipteronia sinensis]
MNQNASVSKELNARHSKNLEGLLKLAENRECADYQSWGPRWASVNLGIFICMQCSESIGVLECIFHMYDLSLWIRGYRSKMLLCNLWVMTSPTSNGKHISHHIATEEVSRNSSASSEMEWYSFCID